MDCVPGGLHLRRERNIGQIGGFTTVYIGSLYEEDTLGGTVRVLYQLNSRAIAQCTVASETPTVVYLHEDQLGSVGGASDAAGQRQALQYYTPFGVIRLTDGLPTTRGFTGQRQDGTGLLFYNAPVLRPAIGTFVRADLIGVRHHYAPNNPLRYSSPNGTPPLSLPHQHLVLRAVVARASIAPQALARFWPVWRICGRSPYPGKGGHR